MSTTSYIGRTSLGLLFAVALAWSAEAQVTHEVVHAGSDMMKEQDPSGIILTLTAVSVVFLALALLVLLFRLIGWAFTPKSSTAERGIPIVAKGEPSEEALVAISLAMHEATGEMDGAILAAVGMALHTHIELQHDYESYVLTLRPRPTQWNTRVHGFRCSPKNI